MATITISAAETGQTTLTKTYTLADSDMDAMVQAYQSAANVSVNGTATRAQVFIFITQGWAAEIQAKIQAFKTVPVSVPAPISIT